MRTLQARGFAIQDEARGVWRLGARWGVLARAAHDQGALAATASPFLAELGQAINENTYLRTRDGLQAETIAVFQVDPELRLYSTPGASAPLHAGASRLLLAYAPEAVQTQVLAQRLPRFTPATRTDAAWIAADLQRIRARGYLITADEVHPGAVSVTVPVRDASGQVVAALFVTAPSMRMRPPRPRSLLPQGTRHCDEALTGAWGARRGGIRQWQAASQLIGAAGDQPDLFTAALTGDAEGLTDWPTAPRARSQRRFPSPAPWLRKCNRGHCGAGRQRR